MRFEKFMREDTSDALTVDEPEVNKKYSDEYVAKRIAIIQDALKKVRGKSMNDEAKEAIMADLNDKLDKWENVDKETKAPEPAAAGPEGGEEEAPAEPEAAPAKEEEPAKEEDKEGEEKIADKEKEEEEKEKKRIKDAEDREKQKTATESIRLIKTRIVQKGGGV